jgi:hypothetical protein
MIIYSLLTFICSLLTIEFSNGFRTKYFKTKIYQNSICDQRIHNTNFNTNTNIHASSNSIELIETFQSWLLYQNFEDIIPKAKMYNLIKEIKSSSSASDSIQPIYNETWDKIEKYIETEKRSLKTLLGTEFSMKLLNAVEMINIYEPTTVRAFLKTPVFEKMLGGILYEGIFEFIQKVDIIGNIVNRLPLIGPLRQTFVKEFRNLLTNSVLGDQLKTFLITFNRIGVERMVEFILSKENQSNFLKANRNVVESLINRPLIEILPTTTSRKDLKNNIWIAINSISEIELLQLCDTFYNNYANMSTKSISASIENIPVVKSSLAGLLDTYLDSPQGKESMKLIIQRNNLHSDITNN